MDGSDLVCFREKRGFGFIYNTIECGIAANANIMEYRSKHDVVIHFRLM